MENKGFDWRTFLTWILRIFVGGVFMFSGLTKAIDPWGTLYKVEDYLQVMGLDIWPNLKLVGVFGLCAIEFLTGIFILAGCFRRSAAIMAAVIMAFMLPFSLWIAIDDPVADCGCFGDAFIISNWATFWKNVVISSAILWLIKNNKKCRWLVTPALQWIA
ncbi:MAG: DoxX family membrane protein, partial [Muribaculaceae bacterium]|nr:DoxX family membrane protein [Muribaculaceae bacterium]